MCRCVSFCAGHSVVAGMGLKRAISSAVAEPTIRPASADCEGGLNSKKPGCNFSPA